MYMYVYIFSSQTESAAYKSLGTELYRCRRVYDGFVQRSHVSAKKHTMTVRVLYVHLRLGTGINFLTRPPRFVLNAGLIKLHDHRQHLIARRGGIPDSIFTTDQNIARI